MTKETKKPEDKVTKAGSVELEEKELDDVQGGGIYIKWGDIDGESLRTDDLSLKIGDSFSNEILKIGDISKTPLKR